MQKVQGRSRDGGEEDVGDLHPARLQVRGVVYPRLEHVTNEIQSG